MSLAVSILCSLFGIGLMVKAILDYRVSSAIVDDGVYTTATIIEVRVTEQFKSYNRDEKSHTPVYEYYNTKQERKTYVPSTTSGLKDYVIGDTVEIAYLPDSEDQVVILDRFGKYGGLWGMTLFGFLFFVAGIVVLTTTGWFRSVFNVGFINSVGL